VFIVLVSLLHRIHNACQNQIHGIVAKTFLNVRSIEKDAHTHTHLTALFRDYPGEPVPEGKTNLDLNEARDSEWRWHQLGHMQFCTLLQTDNHTSTPLLIFTG